ncbi:hypothetical protein V3C99_013496 [Haemonchus contortus]
MSVESSPHDPEPMDTTPVSSNISGPDHQQDKTLSDADTGPTNSKTSHAADTLAPAREISSAPLSPLRGRSSSAHSSSASSVTKPMTGLTTSMEQLTVSLSSTSEHQSSSKPPMKSARSSSGHRKPSSEATSSSAGRGASHGVPRGTSRGLARGASTASTSRSAAAQPAADRPSSSRSHPAPAQARSASASGTAPARGGRRSRPRPLSPMVLPQVNTSQLPRETPEGYTNYLDAHHPWAKYINPRPVHMLREAVPRVISTLDTSVYRHLPDSGYLSTRFNKSLFPQVTLRPERPPLDIPFIELQHLEDTIAFRKRSREVIDSLLAGTYVDPDVSNLPRTSSIANPHTLIPPTWEGLRPVLYQVVSTGWGSGVILEAKDFFTIGPDRRDLHCILLDFLAVDVLAGGRGFAKRLVSIKDFVWVYDVKPSLRALGSPQTTLERASRPRTAVMDPNCDFFFRVAHFALVTPSHRSEPIFGIILTRLTRNGVITSARAAFEGCPEAVTITSSVCAFIRNVVPFRIVSASSRENVSTAMRFSEPPVSMEARAFLADKVRQFLPMHPEEGILPMSVSRISPSDRAWLSDRLENFDNYCFHTRASRHNLDKICNAACSALAAVNAADDDRRCHSGTATVIKPEWFPIRLRFVIANMTSEAGWSPGRFAILWISGSSRLVLTTKNDFSPDEADFLDDYRRLNVAVSRCRHGQFIFGHATALRALPMWNRLLNWAESIRSVIRMADVNRYIYSIHPEPRHW